MWFIINVSYLHFTEDTAIESIGPYILMYFIIDVFYMQLSEDVSAEYMGTYILVWDPAKYRISCVLTAACRLCAVFFSITRNSLSECGHHFSFFIVRREEGGLSLRVLLWF